jgi:hypothetical protein
MPTTVKRVVNGYPLTERTSHEYLCQGVVFTKIKFWSANMPGLATNTAHYFTLTDAVTDAASRGWLTPFDTCTWCQGRGWLRVPYTFTLTECERCHSEGIDPVQPMLYLEVAS